MNENTKKIGLIVLIVAALVAAGLGAKSFFAGDKMEVEVTHPAPAGFKSEKQKFLDAQNGAAPGGAKDDGSRDLGGPIGN
jgi:hypothetical protein